MDEEKIKGSDGVERTLEEWKRFITLQLITSPLGSCERMTISLFEGLIKGQLSCFIESKGENKKELLQAGGEYFQAIAEETQANHADDSGFLENIAYELESLASRLRGKKRRDVNTWKWNIALLVLCYISENEELPRSRRLLHEYSTRAKLGCADGFTRRDIARGLEFLKLEILCRDNSA